MNFSELLDGYSYPWLTMALAGALAVALALIVHAFLHTALRRVTAFSVMASALVEYTAAPARAVLPLLALQVVIGSAPDAPAIPGSRQECAGAATGRCAHVARRSDSGRGCRGHHSIAPRHRRRQSSGPTHPDADSRARANRDVFRHPHPCRVGADGVPRDAPDRHEPARVGGRGRAGRGYRGAPGARQPHRRPANRAQSADPAR